MTSDLDKLLGLLSANQYPQKTLQAGEHLFRQHQPVHAIFGVKSGRVRLYRDLADGSSVTLHVARTGTAFAEATLFAERYHCHAIAEINSIVVTLDSAEVLRAMSLNPDLAINLSRQLAAQVRDMRALLSLRDIRSADERLLAWLRQRANSQTLTIYLDRTWTGISEELGLSKEAVYRSLAKLQQQNIILRQRDKMNNHETITLHHPP
ncbi:MAG: Crp/Fnr family transcriptional regulator [Pseudohongiella sp.]|nr:Crp/Fnr family transcriptional regulator [Pseudohongiella sp.]